MRLIATDPLGTPHIVEQRIECAGALVIDQRALQVGGIFTHLVGDQLIGCAVGGAAYPFSAS